MSAGPYTRSTGVPDSVRDRSGCDGRGAVSNGAFGVVILRSAFIRLQTAGDGKPVRLFGGRQCRGTGYRTPPTP